MHPKVHEIASLFEGYSKAHGSYKLSGEISSTGKIIGKAYTIKEPVTIELWDRHLMGEQGLGIIPIDENSQAKFGAIDIDDYSADMVNIAKRVKKDKLPIVPCRSKSGGIHLFLFCTDPVPASLMQDKLKDVASFLGYGTAEIFPKQTKVLVERGDIGQWINMPYFNAEDTERYALGNDLKNLDITQFLKLANERRLTPEMLTDLAVTPPNDALREGPPCLHHLISQGFPTGTRNNGLFNLGIYAQKSNPDGWETVLETYNNEYMDPPLPPKEVLGVVKSLKKKSYNYTCNAAPVQQFCNASLCRTRRYGVGTGAGMPSFGSLTKLETDPPIWFLDIEGGSRLELSTEDLQQPLRFQKRCMEELNMMPSILKRDDWHQIVQRLLSDVQVVHVPKDSTPRGQLLEMLEMFCTQRAQAKTREDLLLGKPFLFDNRHHFRMKDFMAYLERMKFTELKRNRVASILRDIGARHDFWNINGRGVNLWIIRQYNYDEAALPVPDQSIPEEF